MFLWCSYRFGNTFYYKNPLHLFVFFNDHGVQPRAYWLSRWTGRTATLHRAATLEKIQFTCPRGKRKPFCLWCFIFDDNSYKSGPFSRSSLSFTIFYCGYQIPHHIVEGFRSWNKHRAFEEKCWTHSCSISLLFCAISHFLYLLRWLEYLSRNGKCYGAFQPL